MGISWRALGFASRIMGLLEIFGYRVQASFHQHSRRRLRVRTRTCRDEFLRPPTISNPEVPRRHFQLRTPCPALGQWISDVRNNVS